MSEMIVVDTGSSHQTREVAAGRDARVHDFPWCDDFAAARNESLRHATGDWVLWLVYLSHLSLQQAQAEAAGHGTSPRWDAAEQALRADLRFDPLQACSWRNLALLLWHERGRPGEALATCRAGHFHCPGEVPLLRLEQELLTAMTPRQGNGLDSGQAGSHLAAP